MNPESGQLYWAVGSMIVTNLAAIGAGGMFIGRVIWFLSKMDSRIEKTKEDVDAAHKEIRRLRKQLEVTQ